MSYNPNANWSLDEDGDVIDAKQQCVAMVYTINGTEEDEAFQARQRLLVAAPELLAACELAQMWLSNCFPIGEIEGPKPLPVLAAAIAKATTL